MYRYQVHIQVQLGHSREFHALFDALNVALQAMDLVPFQVWEIAFGRFNEVLLTAEYATLEVYERERSAMHADPACMDLWRQMNAHVDGTPWTDLWWTPARAGNDEPGMVA